MNKSGLWLVIALCLASPVFGGGTSDASGGANVVLAHAQGEWSWSILEDMADAWAERSGNTLELLYVPAEQMAEWTQTQFIAGTEPDLVWSTGQPAADYFKNGWIIDLTEHYEAVSPYTGAPWRDSFRDGILDGVVDPSLGNAMLGMPVAIVTVNLYYNRDIYAELGLPDEAPTSWGQVLEYARVVAQESDYVPYSIQNSLFWNLSWQEFFMMEQLWHEVVETLDIINPNGRLDMSEQALGVKSGVIDLTDDRMVDYYAFMKEFAGYFNRGFNAASWEYERLFNESEAAMNLNGSWFPNQVRMNDIDVNYGMGPLPYVDSSISSFAENRLRRYALGLGGAEVVVTRSANEEAAVDYLQFWSDPATGAAQFTEGFMFIPVVEGVEVPSELAGVEEYIGTDTQQVAWSVHRFTPEEADRYHTMLQTFLEDDTSPEEFVARFAALAMEACDEAIADHPEWRVKEYLDRVSGR